MFYTCLTDMFFSHLTIWYRMSSSIRWNIGDFFINMTSVMIEWLKLTFFRKMNQKRLEVLICFWHESQNLINCFKIDRSILWFDCFRKFFNFLIEKWSKRLCNFRNSISIKKQKLQLKNSMMQFCKTLFHNKNKGSKRQITEMIDFFWIRISLMLL